ncbi:pentapeptide repeat-containing protein [Staphylococcus shinii]|uniref:pentapeptide repeat-containing protein n=1 Tax=Staphylococcus shinii TaxID=2912228 RepID=UPI003EE931F3
MLKYKVINNINRYGKNSGKNYFLTTDNIENVRFFNSNFTYMHFENNVLKNVDFLGCNLKHSIFRKGKFINCIFYNTKLSNSNFKNSLFENCYFINCKFDNVRNFNFENHNVINNDFSCLDVSKNLEEKIFELNRVLAFKRSFIFTTKRSNGNKLNKGILYILKKDFSDKELIKIFSLINRKTNKRIKNFMTYGQFYEFGLRIFKKVL